MIEIEPFCGIVYNQKKVNLAEVVTPPYDMITPEGAEGFYERNPYNIIRLILGRPNHKEDWTSRAAIYFKTWLKEGILKKHKKRGIYPYYIYYTVGKKAQCLKGFITRLRLEPFDKGIIYPHERTFNGIVSERLRLLKACEANFSQVFGLYSDQEHKIIETIDNELPPSPFIQIETDRVRHCVWELTNGHAISKIKLLIKNKKLIIADGHHRYQTALIYKQQMNKLFPNASKDASFNYVAVHLTNLEDPGLSILPSHRLLTDKCIPDFHLAEFLSKINESFEISHYHDQTIFWKKLGEIGNHKVAIGFYCQNQPKFFIFTLRAGVMDGKSIPDSLKGLDVVVLTELIIKEILNLDQAHLEKGIYCISKGQEAIKLIQRRKYKMAFLLNPIKGSQLKEAISKNQLMPHKSTYFYPKILTGLVINSLEDEQ